MNEAKKKRIFDEARAELDGAKTGGDILAMFEKLRRAGVTAIAPTVDLRRHPDDRDTEEVEP